MKTINYKALLAACLPFLIFSCKPEMVAPVASKGSVDATTYVAIGNSFSAGYADNALYNAGQQNSLPNLLAQQLKYIQGGNFKQPLMEAASVGFGSTGNAHYVLAPSTDCKGAISLSPVPVAAKGDLGFFTPVAGPFNNIGVPGAKAIYMIYPGYGNGTPGSSNPFFGRMASNPANSSMLSDAAAQNPTFFSYYGSDDFMGYALAGGAADAVTPSAGGPGMGFDASIDLIIGSLTANNAKGVIGNMPYVRSLPFFTTVPYNGLLLDEANAAALTYAYSPLQITFHAGYNGFIIQAGDTTRQIKQGELILLSIPQDSLKCGGWGTMKPIPDQYVLTAKELETINAATDAYNSKLKSAAATMHLAFVDVNAFMSHLNSGIVYNGVGINAQFVAGGAFSLDGIHLSPQGNALLANEFIKAINSTYGSTIPQLNASMYKGVAFP